MNTRKLKLSRRRTLLAAMLLLATMLGDSAQQLQRSELPLLAASNHRDDAGSQQAYDRSATMRSRVQGKVINERINASWLDQERLIYRLQSRLESWRFMIADGKAGETEEAFDHADVAQALADLTGNEHDPEALPFTRFKALDQRTLLARIQGGGEHSLVEIDLRRSRVSEADVEQKRELDLPTTTARRSRNGGSESAVIFVNESRETLTLWWVSAAGERKRYGELAGDERRDQHTFAGHLWLITNPDGDELGWYMADEFPGTIRLDGSVKVIEAAQDARDPALAPDGELRAFIRDHNVWLRDAESGDEEALSSDGSAPDQYRRQFWWSPDSRWLVAMRVKPAQGHTVSMVESSPRDRVQPRLHQMNYLKPGDRIRQDRPILFDLRKREQVEVDNALFATPWSITQLAWDAESEAFSFIYNQRGHQVMRLIQVRTDGDVRALASEEPDTFVDYSQKTYLHRLPEQDQAIWASERSGYNHLYLLDTDRPGKARAITSGEWLVRRVERVDAEAKRLRFWAMGVFDDQDPYHQHLGEINFDGSGLVWLTGGDGTQSVDFSPGEDYLVARYSRVDLPPIYELRNAQSGERILTLAEADWTPLLETGWKPPVRLSAKGRDGTTDIWGYVIEPSQLQRGQSVPVIESIYAGPHDHHVPKDFRAWRGQRELSELGFYVVKIDGMGTNWRSKAFHDHCWQNIGDGGFADRIAWIKAAAERFPAMDLDRVGIYGGSAGGQNALRAMLAHGDFYRAAAADCGCHDNRMDKIWWNEAWMGWPIDSHYAEQSNVTQAHHLQGDLLLTVGELDRNVDPASTMQVVAALIRAGKDFELIVFPGAGHGIGEREYGRRRRADFFVRSLLDRQPRWGE